MDRVLVNSDWEGRFSGSEAFFLPASISDHSSMVVKLSELPRLKKPKKFFDKWAPHPDFIPLVEEVWSGEVDFKKLLCFGYVLSFKSLKVGSSIGTSPSFLTLAVELYKLERRWNMFSINFSLTR